jgi:hypothetical protein
MKLSDAYPSRFLRASDLNGRTATVTIESAEFEKFGSEKERKIVLSFVGKDKQLILNKTNANTIAELLHSEETDDWINQRITLCARETEFQGGDGARVEGAGTKAGNA